jgi:DNA repair exonuclease SbcCD ATPase subunit
MIFNYGKKYYGKSFEELYSIIKNDDLGYLKRLEANNISRGDSQIVKNFLDYYNNKDCSNEIKQNIFYSILSENKIDKIIHLADIHIRLWLRMEEYQHVFNNLYKMLEKEEGNCLIVVVGDILHNKIDLVPETITMTQNFFIALASYFPTICIAGNHDALLNNTQRLDSLTAIFSQIAIPNFYYLKTSGIYKYGNIHFGVCSLIDDIFIKAESLPNDGTLKICLYHGTVDTSKNLVGFELKGDKLVSDFDGYDYAMLGDIHYFQYLNEQKTIAYSSSLISQGFAEADEYHGYLRWDLVNKSSSYQIVENDYRYVTIDDIIPDKLPKYGIYKIYYYEKEKADEIINHIKKYTISPKFKLECKNKKDNKKISDTLAERTLELYCQERNFDYENIVSEINNINKTILIKQDKTTLEWQLLKLKFDNLFGYGKGNEIDFTQLEQNEVIGIFADNSSGKSSLIDIICFALWGKTSRFGVNKIPLYLINCYEDVFSLELQFSIGSDIYTIKKSGQKKNGKIQISVQTLYLNGDKNLSDEHRLKTDKVINSLIGTYEDFISTSIYLQSGNNSFKDLSQIDKKKKINALLNLSSFNEIEATVKTTYKDIKKELTTFSLNVIEQKDIDNEKKSYIFYQTEIDEVENRIDELRPLIVPVLNNVPPLHIVMQHLEELNSKKTEYENKKKSYVFRYNSFEELDENKFVEIQNKIKELSQKIHQNINIDCNENIDDLRRQLNNIIIDDNEYIIQHLWEQEIKCNMSIEAINAEIDYCEKNYDNTITDKYLNSIKNEMKLKKALEWKQKLDEHKYDPNCQFCTNNELVIEAQKYIDEIPVLKENILPNNGFDLKVENDKLSDRANFLKGQKILILHREKENQIKLQKEIELKIKALENKKIKEEILQLEESNKNFMEMFKEKEKHIEFTMLCSLLKTIENDIELYDKMIILAKENIVKINIAKKYHEEMMNCESNLNNLRNELDKIDKKISMMEELLEKNYEMISDKKEKEKKLIIYEQLLELVSPNGFSLYMTKYCLPIINNEVNILINEYMNRTIELVLDEDQIQLNAYKEDGTMVNTFGGAEGFVLELAFKITLGKLAHLPQSNLLIIDEGISALDYKHLQDVNKLFSFLKKHYSHVIVISHIQELKNYVKNQLIIKKRNNQSIII